MANTNVVLVNSGGVFVPSVAGVAVNAGDTVSFSTSDGSAAALYFSPAAAAAVSPAPGSLYSIPAGGSAAFTFTSSAAGAYSIVVGASGDTAPTDFPTQVSQSLALLINTSGLSPTFSAPHNTTNPGS